MEAIANSKRTLERENSKSTVKVLPALITGQAAGLIMAIVVMIVFATFLGKNPLFPVQVIGAVAFGSSALEGFHIGAILAGLLLHQLGPSLLWGGLFAVIAEKFDILTVKQSLFTGIAIGVVSMVGPYVLIPAVMNTLHGVDFWNQEVPMFWDWAAHITFGASFGLYPLIKNKMKTLKL